MHCGETESVDHNPDTREGHLQKRGETRAAPARGSNGRRAKHQHGATNHPINEDRQDFH
jgi:hypothetical protein